MLAALFVLGQGQLSRPTTLSADVRSATIDDTEGLNSTLSERTTYVVRGAGVNVTASASCGSNPKIWYWRVSAANDHVYALKVIFQSAPRVVTVSIENYDWNDEYYMCPVLPTGITPYNNGATASNSFEYLGYDYDSTVPNNSQYGTKLYFVNGFAAKVLYIPRLKSYGKDGNTLIHLQDETIIQIDCDVQAAQMVKTACVHDPCENCANP